MNFSAKSVAFHSICAEITGAIAKHVYDYSMPISLGELVNNMMEKFAGQQDFPSPEGRMVRN
jgi:hypothetical protein